MSQVSSLVLLVTGQMRAALQEIVDEERGLLGLEVYLLLFGALAVNDVYSFFQVIPATIADVIQGYVPSPRWAVMRERAPLFAAF